ncbi:hypothetical protein CCYA_CCYA14G3774 [Cyanidiococcus yangmingshanensis]|nr:hypothetical protein CCYA_CCYA14G3774 [Cyanidiococcus yangmingshanensis]
MELWLPADREVSDAAAAHRAKAKGAGPARSADKAAFPSASELSHGPETPVTSRVTEVRRRRLKLLFQVARNAESAGRLSEAKGLIRQCLELDRHDARSWLMLARLEASTVSENDVRGDVPTTDLEGTTGVLAAYERARDVYRQGLSYCPNSVHLLHAWAVFECRGGDTKLAEELFRRGLELDPCNAYIYHSWGLMEQRTGCHEKARQLFREGVLRCLSDALCVAWAELEASDGQISLARCIFELGLALVLDDYEDVLVSVGTNATAIDYSTETAHHRPWSALRDLVRKMVHEELIKDKPATKMLSSKSENSKRVRTTNPTGSAVSTTSSESVLRTVLYDRLRWHQNRTTPGQIHIHLHGHSKRFNQDRFMLAAEIAVHYAETERIYGSVTRTRELLQWALDLHPTNVQVLLSCARLDAQRGAITRARSLFRAAESALGNDPTDDKVDRAPHWRSRREGVSLYVAWATMEMDENMLNEADAVLERGNQRFPNRHALYQTWGLVRDRQGHFEAARLLFAQSIRCQPNAPAYVAWALLEERLGFYQQARKLFEAALRIDLGHGPAYNAYGRMEARLGNLEQSRQIFLRGLVAQHSPCIYHGYAIVEWRYGHGAERAEAILRQGVAKKGSETVFLWHTLGALALHQRKYEEARAVFAESLRTYPTNSRLLVGAALSEAALGTRDAIERARVLFRQAVVADPLHGHAWQCWGVFETRQGNLDAARALFERGVERCPRHASLWQAYGLLESTAGDTTKARALFERGESLGCDHVHLLNAHACLEARQGNYRKASALLERAIEIDPQHGASWNAYALLEMRHANKDRARQLLERGLENDANHTPLYRTYARLEMECQNWDRARALLEQGLAIDSQDSGLEQLLVALEKRSGLSVEAALRQGQVTKSSCSRTQRSPVPADIRVDLSDEAFARIDLDHSGTCCSSAESMEDALDHVQPSSGAAVSDHENPER